MQVEGVVVLKQVENSFSQNKIKSEAQILFNKTSYQVSLYPLYSYTFHVL